jgi:competence protein ComEA
MKRFLLLLVTLLFSAFAPRSINTATKEELDALPEIGPVKAQAIVDYRNANGPFKTPEDIMKVSGIKEGTYSKVKGMISVTGPTTPVAAPAAGKSETKAVAPAPMQPAPPAMQPAPAAKSATPATPASPATPAEAPRRRCRPAPCAATAAPKAAPGIADPGRQDLKAERRR